MAIQTRAAGLTDLRLGSGTGTAITKAVTYTSNRTIGGVSALYGNWIAWFCRFPRSADGNIDYVIAGSNGNTAYTGASDSNYRIGGNNPSRGTGRLKAVINLRGNGGLAFTGTENIQTGLDQTPDGNSFRPTGFPFLIVQGINYVSGTATWRSWTGMVDLTTGAVTSNVGATATSNAWLTGTNNTLLRQVLPSIGQSSDAPAGTIVEHMGLFNGNFPWDTANNRPHHDALAALAGFGSNPFLTYQGLIAAQNANTLPYSNLEMGKSEYDWHWSLSDLTTAGLNNLGTRGTGANNNFNVRALVADTTGIEVLPGPNRIAPAHWYNVGGVTAIMITEPNLRAVGGMGTRASVVSGTKDSAKTIQRRWWNLATGAVQSGFDWANVGTQSGTTWTVSDTIPSGWYRLDMR